MRTSILGGFLLLLTACSSPSNSLNHLGKDDVILAFGDSLTYGTGVSADQSYPAVLSQLIQRQVIRSGVPGELSVDGLERLPGVLQDHRPALMILIHGGNDILRKKDLNKTVENLRSMIELARTNGTQVVMMSVPNPTLILSPAAFYEPLAKEMNVPIAIGDIADILQHPSNKSDAVHPNAKGYRMMAERLSDLLQKNGAL